VTAEKAGMSLEAMYRSPVLGLLSLGDGRTAFLQNVRNYLRVEKAFNIPEEFLTP